MTTHSSPIEPAAPLAASRAQSLTPDTPKTIFWHRDLPPLDAEAIGEHTVEADSPHVPGTLAHRDHVWDECYAALMAQVAHRIGQEIERLGGNYAHVLTESIEARHNDVAVEAWLHGRFAYALYRRP
jgi:hypothetical protein